jgi:alpha-L-fucosidase
MAGRGCDELPNHLIRTAFPQGHTEFGYKDFIRDFTASSYDPTRWTHLFREAGAQFVVPVVEHHDGFAMYNSGRSRWNATEMAPQRDVIGELAQAVRHQSLVFGAPEVNPSAGWTATLLGGLGRSRVLEDSVKRS